MSKIRRLLNVLALAMASLAPHDRWGWWNFSRPIRRDNGVYLPTRFFTARGALRGVAGGAVAVDAALEDKLAEMLLPALEKARSKQYGYKHDASGTPIATGYSHGPGGALTFPGVDPDVFHTVVGNIGLLMSLPTKASIYTDPVYQIITGVQDESGAEKTTVCSNAPTAGLVKACKLSVPFGRYERATPELELNRLGQFNDRADPMDLRMIGTPVHQSGIFSTGPGDPTVPGAVLVNEVARKMWELGVAFHRLLSVQLWRGNPSNNSAGGGYKECPGLDILIGTGHTDIETNTSCPSVDSDLKNFTYRRVNTNGSTIVEMMSYLIKTRRDLAERTGVMPVRWMLAMRPELFWELTNVWPCAYLTYRCEVTGNQRLNIDVNDQIALRDAMRQGKYLLIDGDRIEVALDDGIAEITHTQNGNVPSGCFASSIYLIPMSVIGGQSVTFLEYADYGNPSLRDALGDSLVLARADGAFLTWPRQTNQCVIWQSKVEPRIVLRTPWLAGKIQNVVYCPAQHTREPFPDDPYFVDGGVTSRPGPSYYQGLW